MKRIAIAVLILGSVAAVAADSVKSFYKVSHISQSILGVSCPGNHGDPTVITNVSGTLLISCGN